MGCKNCGDNTIDDFQHTHLPNRESTTSVEFKCPNNHHLFNINLRKLEKCALYEICNRPEKRSVDYCVSGKCSQLTHIAEVEARCPLCGKNTTMVFVGKDVSIIPPKTQDIFIKDIGIYEHTIVVTLGAI